MSIIKRIYCDMDNTLCDMTTPYLKALKDNPEIKYPQSQYGFFTNLKPIEGAIEAFFILAKDYDVWILSKPSVMNPLCYTEKRVWVEKYLGYEYCEKLILCCEKGLLKGDFLIDDNPWPNFEGKQILFGGQDYPNWRSVLKYFIKT